MRLLLMLGMGPYEEQFKRHKLISKIVTAGGKKVS